MSNRIEVCRESELSSGERRVVSRGNVSIGVFNVDGEYHALLNSCPHQNGPLCEGELAREIEGEFVEPGRHIEERFTDERMVVCPWHSWAFNVQTGEHVGDNTITVPTYNVVVEDGVIYIEP